MTRVVADDILGKLARQQNDLFRRVREGSLDVELVSTQLQQIIEGRFSVPMEEIAPFADQIRAGNYGHLYGFAKNPEDIKGQTYHSVTSETELDHPDMYLKTKEIYEKYGDQMAGLCELLDYGIKNPNVQRNFLVGIVWKDENGQFWEAYLGNHDPERSLGVVQASPRDEWHCHSRFLVRK